MNNQKNNNGRGIFYGVIGVATLVVAIIGATFAYFTAIASNGVNEITGDMASISLDMEVTKVVDPGETTGLIPMSNNMVEAAVSKKGTSTTYSDGDNSKADDAVCVDDNGNAVCQIYKATLKNTSTAAIFIDGYITLSDKTEHAAGVATDAGSTATKNVTIMRWAQVFPNAGSYSTGLVDANAYTLGGTTNLTWDSIDNPDDTTGYNNDNILKDYSKIVTIDDSTSEEASKVTIKENGYAAIRRNFIRISDHTSGNSYGRTDDVTSALVFNQRVDARISDSEPSTQDYYFVVWLSETGKSQNNDATTVDGDNQNNVENESIDLFTGVVTFVSASGSEVSGTFQGLATRKA